MDVREKRKSLSRKYREIFHARAKLSRSRRLEIVTANVDFLPRDEIKHFRLFLYERSPHKVAHNVAILQDDFIQ